MRPGFVIVVLLILGVGCASTQSNSRSIAASAGDVNSSSHAAFDEFEDEVSQNKVTISDPLEASNRLMFGINDRLYFWVAKPVLQTYEKIVPHPARVGIGNFFENISTPARLVNCLLQGKCPQADRELRRFGINTTVGILGFGDPARDRWNLVPAKEDLGQTLAVYGFGNGFYIVWPIFGPSTLRDSAGMVGDSFLNPVRYVEPVEASIGISVFDAVNDGSFHIGEYETFKSASVEPYVAMRGAYIQYRSKQIEE
jgi:phospholipid-binding lipoprotein MlaA